ncbi:MAG TPA: hypothetical protein PKU80_13675 [Candidatus Limiplasma sp.]|nr:hypothetical protein [Candidatus Limiplasma sp.]
MQIMADRYGLHGEIVGLHYFAAEYLSSPHFKEAPLFSPKLDTAVITAELPRTMAGNDRERFPAALAAMIPLVELYMSPCQKRLYRCPGHTDLHGDLGSTRTALTQCQDFGFLIIRYDNPSLCFIPSKNRRSFVTACFVFS